MRHLVVRYGEIGTKSRPVRSKMKNRLRQRVEDRLRYEDSDFESVSARQGRVIVEDADAEEAAGPVSEVPGVSSVSPAVKTDSKIEEMKRATADLEVGETFGIRANRAGDHPFDSKKVEEELGEHVRKRTRAEVDLGSPETWIEFDIRFDDTYVFTDRIHGPDGFPVGSGGPLAALISGGIDSPVAAYEAMKRGSDVVPVYFYNRPLAAEDHVIRLEAVLRKLERFHPAKEWSYRLVDMEEVNRKLMKTGRGRMLLHREVMFRTTERIAEKEGLKGIVTGESLSQKSSQTASNQEKTSSTVDLPIHRPLLTRGKNSITEQAKKIGTFRDSRIDSACRSLAPEKPATEMKESELKELRRKADIETLVEKALKSTEERKLS